MSYLISKEVLSNLEKVYIPRNIPAKEAKINQVTLYIFGCVKEGSSISL